MLAMNFRGPYRVRAIQKAEPKIEHPEDCIARVLFLHLRFFLYLEKKLI